MQPALSALVQPDDFVGLDVEVPVFGGQSRRFVNLDSAASTPPLRVVRDAVHEFATYYSSVHRGAGFKSQLSTRVFEGAREQIARFVGADDAHVVIYIKNTTEGLNRLARLFAVQHAIVFTSLMEHHANMLPWRYEVGDLRYFGADAQGVIDLDDLAVQLANAPTDRPRIVSVSGAYNVTGYTPPIHAIARLVHRYGAQIVVDGAQLVPHRPVAMRGSGDDTDDGIDYLVFSAHKAYAPYGSGALIAPRSAFDGTLPLETGGGIVDMVTLDSALWSELPDREEAGSPNVMGALAVGVAVQYLGRLGMANVARHEDALTAYLMGQMAAVPGVRVLGPPAGPDRLGVVSFVLDDVDHMQVAAVLSHEHGVGVRAGCFCAHPGLLHMLQIEPCVVEEVQARIRRHSKLAIPGATRVSLGLFSTRHDVDRFIDGLRAIAHGHIAADYQVDERTGEYLPVTLINDFDQYFNPFADQSFGRVTHPGREE